MDKLNATIQHIDSHGKALLDMTHPTGPVHQAQLQYFKKVTSAGGVLVPVSTLVRHFENHPDLDVHEVECQARAKALHISSQIWTRLEVPFAAYPWLLVRVKDPRTPLAEALRLLRDFLQVVNFLLKHITYVMLSALRVAPQQPTTTSAGNQECKIQLAECHIL